MRRSVFALCAGVAVASWMVSHPAVRAAAPPPDGALTIEKLLEIRHPSGAAWSPDGKHVAFVWERAGVQNLFVSDIGAAGAAPKALTNYPAGDIGGHFWAADGNAVYFARQGELWRVGLDGAAP